MTDVVETRDGRVRGVRWDGVRAFRGIPYARPPVGRLRFAAPRPPEPWSGVRDAGAFGHAAPQNLTMMGALPGMDMGPQSEDCLTLNVFTPEAGGAPRPVMVWIHGGGFTIGSSSQELYDAAPLVRRGGVVVVTINYRLGALGFLDLTAAGGEAIGAAPNAGLLDQVTALEWVRDNAAAFGGDPEQVTVFGESAGGMSVGALLGMPSAGGLFRRAVLQSGAGHNAHSAEGGARAVRRYLRELDLGPGDAAKLRELPVEAILDAQQRLVIDLRGRLGLLPFQPVVDGKVLPERPIDAVRAGSAAGVPVLTGTTHDEWRLFGAADPKLRSLDEATLHARLARPLSEETAREVVDAYRRAREGRAPTDPASLLLAIQTDRVFRIPALRLAEAQHGHGARAFVYRFDWESPALGGALGACHAVDLAFVFGTLDKKGMNRFAGSGPEARALSERCMDAWLGFARGGDPSHEELGAWPVYDTGRRPTMLLGPERSLAFDPDADERRVWEGLL